MSIISGEVRDTGGTPVSGRTVRLYQRSNGTLLQSKTSSDGSTHDSSFSQVSLLLRLDGTNGSVIFTDSGPNNFQMTYSGSPSISTTQGLTTGASLSLAGGSSYLITPSSTAFAFTTGSFTLEAWIRCGAALLGYVFSSRHLSNGVVLRVYNNRLEAFYGGGSGVITGNTNHPVNTWFHVALVKDGSVVKLYQGGVEVASGNWGAAVINNTASPEMHIGSWAGSESFVGFIDECRVTKGVARYTGNFTPVAASFPEGPLLPVGGYSFSNTTPNDSFVVCLDSTGTRNDLIVRTKAT